MVDSMSMRAAPSAEANPVGVSHFGLMDQVYRRQRHVYDFTRKYYLLGRDSLIRDLDLKPGQRLVRISLKCWRRKNRIWLFYRCPTTDIFSQPWK